MYHIQANEDTIGTFLEFKVFNMKLPSRILEENFWREQSSFIYLLIRRNIFTSVVLYSYRWVLENFQAILKPRSSIIIV